MMMCEQCMHLEYDEALGESVCTARIVMDEDDFARMSYYKEQRCPFYRIGDEYITVRKQK